MTTPDLTTYRGVHLALRLGARRLALALADDHPLDHRRLRAIARYWHGYSTEVVLHHTIEDDVIFPALAQQVTVFDRHAERVDRDHLALDHLMEAATTALSALREQATPAGRALAASAFRELADHMDEHLSFEDDDVLPLIERHFDATEYLELEAEANRRLGVGRQAAFTVPFVLEAATPADRAHMLAHAPKAFAVLHRLTRRSHARLLQRVLGPGRSLAATG